MKNFQREEQWFCVFREDDGLMVRKTSAFYQMTLSSFFNEYHRSLFLPFLLQEMKSYLNKFFLELLRDIREEFSHAWTL